LGFLTHARGDRVERKTVAIGHPRRRRPSAVAIADLGSVKISRAFSFSARRFREILPSSRSSVFVRADFSDLHPSDFALTPDPPAIGSINVVFRSCP
jgi:hypothetical protein